MWNIISVTAFHNYKYVVDLHNTSSVCDPMQLGMHERLLAKTWSENQTLTPLQNHKEEREKNRPRVE